MTVYEDWELLYVIIQYFKNIFYASKNIAIIDLYEKKNINIKLINTYTLINSYIYNFLIYNNLLICMYNTGDFDFYRKFFILHKMYNFFKDF